MDATSAIKGERVIDVREISPRVRHTVIFQLFEHLDGMNSLQLISDHDPTPLRLQLEAKHSDGCRWTYLEQGPDLWRVRLRRDRQNEAVKSTCRRRTTGECHGAKRAH